MFACVTVSRVDFLCNAITVCFISFTTVLVLHGEALQFFVY